MALATWPTSLPNLAGSQSAFGSSQLYQPPAVTKMSDGPPRMRVEAIYDVTPFDLQLLLTADQADTFRAFMRDSLNNGSSRFTGPVVLRDRTVATRTCWIEGAVSLKPLGLDWTASFTLQVKDW